MIFWWHLKKKISSGFASFEIEDGPWRPTEISILSICVNQVLVPELQFVIHDEQADMIGRKLTEELSKTMPVQDFPVNVTAHLTKNPDFYKNDFGKSFGSRKTNYHRNDLYSLLLSKCLFCALVRHLVSTRYEIMNVKSYKGQYNTFKSIKNSWSAPERKTYHTGKETNRKTEINWKCKNATKHNYWPF